MALLEANRANDILLAYWSGRSIPVDPVEIARSMGVTVRPGNASELNKASGWYRNNGIPTIIYNTAESKVRQRFTIAHELGHHVLDHGPRPRDTISAFEDPYDPYEIEANQFAAELLMPDFALKILIEKKNVTSLKSLATAFNVSEHAMYIRLKKLGYIK